MRKARQGLGFALETLGKVRAGAFKAGRENFDRHPAIEAFLPALIHCAHPASPEHSADFVLRKTRLQLRRLGRMPAAAARARIRRRRTPLPWCPRRRSLRRTRPRLGRKSIGRIRLGHVEKSCAPLLLCRRNVGEAREGWSLIAGSSINRVCVSPAPSVAALFSSSSPPASQPPPSSLAGCGR